jgi:hypothetical protein
VEVVQGAEQEVAPVLDQVKVTDKGAIPVVGEAVKLTVGAACAKALIGNKSKNKNFFIKPPLFI